MSRKSILLLGLYSLVLGPVVAFISHLFLFSLDQAQKLRGETPGWIWILPILGMLMAFGRSKLSERFHWGVAHLITELRTPRHRANPLLSIWIFVTSVLSHLGGGSVGREGVGLVVSGSLVDGITPWKEDSRERSIMLQGTLSAGFTGMFGTPLAGLIFIFELNQFREILSPLRWLMILLATFSTYFCGLWLETPHASFESYGGASWQGLMLLVMGIAIASYTFYYVFVFLHHQMKRLGHWQSPVGGLLITLILFYFGTRYSGLGTGIILEATQGKALPWDWILKLLLTAFTIASGFKGGEVTPLFFIGSTMGAWLGSYTGDTELAKIGFVAVFGSLTHTPIAAAVLSAELFGAWSILPSLGVTYAGVWALRNRHLYRLE